MIFEPTSKEASTADCRAYAVRASALEACRHAAQESVGHLGVDLLGAPGRQGRRDAAGLIRHERRALRQQDHPPERPRRNPRGGGVVNAPAWAGFATWGLVRGSNVVRSLRLEANGDDTLSITADCYSVAAADAALAAALLAYYTSAQVDALLVDYRTGTAQDAKTTSAISAALLAYYTSAQVDALLADYRTASAQDTQTQATRTCSRPTRSLRRWWRTARPPTRTRQRPRASPPPAQLLHHCTGGQFAGRQARSHGGSLALEIAVRFPDDGLANWTVRPSSGRSRRSERTP